jgi:hypothetical protein
MTDVTSLNSGPSTFMRTVDDSKTSTLNLWTSDYITTYLKSLQPILFAGTMQWTGCSPGGWRPFYMTAYKPEQQSLYITADKTAFKCERAGVYVFTLNVIEHFKTMESFYAIDFLSSTNPIVVGKNYAVNNNMNPMTFSRTMSLTAGQNVKFNYWFQEACSIMRFASFVIQEMR